MANFTIKGKPFSTNGELPGVGKAAPAFKLTNGHLKDKFLKDFKGKKKIIYTVTSLDTDICEQTARQFSQLFGKQENAVLLIVSGDLPFAQSRVTKEQHIENAVVLSELRDRNFATDYGILIQDGPLAGLMARAVFVVDENDNLIYSELVTEITESPNYGKALSLLN